MTKMGDHSRNRSGVDVNYRHIQKGDCPVGFSINVVQAALGARLWSRIRGPVTQVDSEAMVIQLVSITATAPSAGHLPRRLESLRLPGFRGYADRKQTFNDRTFVPHVELTVTSRETYVRTAVLLIDWLMRDFAPRHQ